MANTQSSCEDRKRGTMRVGCSNAVHFVRADLGFAVGTGNRESEATYHLLQFITRGTMLGGAAVAGAVVGQSVFGSRRALALTVMGALAPVLKLRESEY